jgi:hypothetical protein
VVVDDDATELAHLRRRAYGPGADIEDDPEALARLIALEDAARGAPETSAVVTPAAAAPRPLRRRGGWHMGLVAVVAAVALVLSALAWQDGGPAEAPAAPPAPAPTPDPFGDASPFAGDAAARVLIQVPIDGSFGDYFDRPVSGIEPPFPVPEDLRWSAPLGQYYGWQLWLARSRSGLPCVALVAGNDVRADCLPQVDFDRGALAVTVPFADVAADERPDGMRPAESLGYLWLPDDTVTIVVGRTHVLAR